MRKSTWNPLTSTLEPVWLPAALIAVSNYGAAHRNSTSNAKTTSLHRLCRTLGNWLVIPRRTLSVLARCGHIPIPSIRCCNSRRIPLLLAATMGLSYYGRYLRTAFVLLMLQDGSVESQLRNRYAAIVLQEEYDRMREAHEKTLHRSKSDMTASIQINRSKKNKSGDFKQSSDYDSHSSMDSSEMSGRELGTSREPRLQFDTGTPETPSTPSTPGKCNILSERLTFERRYYQGSGTEWKR